MKEISETETPRAGRAVIADPPGDATTLTLYSADTALAELLLGPAECVALASVATRTGVGIESGSATRRAADSFSAMSGSSASQSARTKRRSTRGWRRPRVSSTSIPWTAAELPPGRCATERTRAPAPTVAATH